MKSQDYVRRVSEASQHWPNNDSTVQRWLNDADGVNKPSLTLPSRSLISLDPGLRGVRIDVHNTTGTSLYESFKPYACRTACIQTFSAPSDFQSKNTPSTPFRLVPNSNNGICLVGVEWLPHCFHDPNRFRGLFANKVQTCTPLGRERSQLRLKAVLGRDPTFHERRARIFRLPKSEGKGTGGDSRDVSV
ncbi:hypothetical protein PM082_002860 [Marasmius tenuissimus]|nr:hypothetical protein PM082_002860 [Marasmius tenuissimus]